MDIPVTTCDLVYFLNRLQFQCQNKSLDGVSGIVLGMGDTHIHLDSRVYVPTVMTDFGGAVLMEPWRQKKVCFKYFKVIINNELIIT